MGLITKMNGVAFANINKYSGTGKANTKKFGGTGNFHNKNAVSVALDTSGSGHEVFIADSDGDYKFDHDDAMSVSFWVKAGWNASHGGAIMFFSSNDAGGDSNADTLKIYLWEPSNRLYVEWRSASNEVHNQFWHFHDDGGIYDEAHTASGGPNPWNVAARGNVGDDDYTLITITRGTANTALDANLKCYWNATDCGEGYYRSGTSGGSGTPNMGNSTDKEVALGNSVWAYSHPGNNVETKYMGLTIWNKILTAGEVVELYNSGAPYHVGTHSAYANCVGWWPFQDDGVGEVAGTQTFVINGDSNLEAK